MAIDGNGLLVLQVQKIAENFSSSGPLHAQDARTRQSLLAAGAPGSRVNGSSIHCGGKIKPAFPKTLKKILVISPEDSEGLADFSGEIATSRRLLTVTYRNFRGSSDAAPELLEALIREANEARYDLILIIRGGGDWASLRPYNHPTMALAVACSKVPVASAIGHKSNTSMVDRAAAFSFTTPTAAGKALSAAVWSSAKTNGADTKNRKGAKQTSLVRSVPGISDEATTQLRSAREEAASLRETVDLVSRTHISDLIGIAVRRVSLLSKGVSVLTVTGCASVVMFQNAILLTLGVTGSPLSNILFSVMILVISFVALKAQRSRRLGATQPARRDMKRPPENFYAWRDRIKRTVTVRELRQLIRHNPRSR
ncbi:exodeoxyribonuclease VII large subunit [Paenarthrobacter sp. NPDC089714]|uniref:exodeoxyribonuclease VII large subunit n=1 Tax=Paenarthrobacter sp. NPDC089714 TaxID=3364377 RepID=UPI00380A62E8